MNQAAVTGIGLVSPFGNTLDQFINGLKSQRKVTKRISIFNVPGHEDSCGAEITLPEFCNETEKRILYMGKKAIMSAIEDWDGDLADFKRIALIIGSGLGLTDQAHEDICVLDQSSYLSSLGDKLAASLEIKCEVIYICNACVASSQAISYGMDLLDSQCFDLVIAGGIESLSLMALSGFLRLYSLDKNGCKPFDKDRKGIMVGEGAAFFILERTSEIISKRKNVYCILAGAGISNDAYNIVQIDPSGTEIKRAMDQAFDVSGLSKSDIDLIVAHGTGTTINDKVESKIINEYFKECLSSINVTTSKGATGHTGGSSGAFGLLTGIGALLTGCIPPILNLKNVDPDFKIPLIYGKYKKHKVEVVMVNAFAFGGTNIILICKKWNKDNQD